GEGEPPRFAERKMVARLVAHLERLQSRRDDPVAHREAIGRVIEERVPTPLRLKQQREGRVARDVDALDWVHLDRDLQGHPSLPFLTHDPRALDGPMRPMTGSYGPLPPLPQWRGSIPRPISRSQASPHPRCGEESGGAPERRRRSGASWRRPKNCERAN